MAGNTVTFAVAGTSNVADGASIPIPGLTERRFTWSGTLWYGTTAGSTSVGFPLGATTDMGFQPNSVANSALNVHQNASSQNGINIAATNNAGVAISVISGASNEPLSVDAKGSSSIKIGTVSTGNIVLGGVTGGGGVNGSVTISNASALVNYLFLQGSATGASTLINAKGSDTNVSMNINSQAAGDINIQTGATGGQVKINPGGLAGLYVIAVASAVNYVAITNAVTTAAPIIAARGSDTNIDITITPKGTGVLNFAYASVVVSGATPAVLGKTGGGPSSATQYGWRASKAGTLEYVPVWR